MLSSETKRVLQVIAHNIDLARRFVAGMTFDGFSADERTLYAVTRGLEIVSEASRRLPSDLKARHGHIPWDRIAGSGNVYRHDYEDVLASILWNTVEHHLHDLERAVLNELAESEGD